MFRFVSNATPKTVVAAIDGWTVRSIELPKDGPVAPQFWLHEVEDRHGARLVAALRRNYRVERVADPQRLPTGRPIISHMGASSVRRYSSPRR